MRNSKIAWILVVILFTTSVLFACLYLSERHSLQRTRAVLDMTEKSEAGLRSNVQAAIAVSDKQEAQSAAQDRLNLLCGIYNCDAQTVIDGRVDLRSDGSAVLFIWTGSRWYPKAKTNWRLDGSSVMVGTQPVRKFTIEQADLIDSRGNRWIHTR